MLYKELILIYFVLLYINSMTNISDIFSAKNYKSEIVKKKVSGPSPSLNQGRKYKNYKKKISDNLEKQADNLSGKEGFSDLSDTGLTSRTHQIIHDNDYSKQQKTIDNLRQQYDDTLEQYQQLMDEISGDTSSYINRVSPNNPYLNKTIRFTTGHICYVTNQGIVKYIPSVEIWNSTNISKNFTQINLPYLTSYQTPGTQIQTIPPLISGTNVQMNQSFGNEGSNVFVNEFLPENTQASYLGCYAANSSNTNMTFIGDSPPTGQLIQNGNFSQPVLTNNSYQYINSDSQVPGWYLNACLINNSSAWGYSMPYPFGNQCVSIQNTDFISTTITLNTGVTYTITFSACSRNCCNNQNVGNPINLQLYTNLNAFISTIANFTPSPVNNWQNFSYTFTVPTSQTYKLFFSGTNTSGDQSTAIANINLNSSSTSSGNYSYNNCKQSAIQQGYQFFALQNVNSNSGLGYCAVSNSEPSVTQYGNSMVPNKLIPLWSSNTSGQTGNTATLSVTGSLQVINSGGQAVYSTPGTNANPTNYLGCYQDGPSRAMSVAYNGGSQQYNNSQCQQISKQSGYQYYGLQNSTSGTNAQCFLSNNLSQTVKYGKATNCTKISDGSWSGGGWSNAVYNASLPQSNYFLMLLDDGNMCIYRGTGPNDNQGFIWCTMTNGKQQSANPKAAASFGKYGKNWISGGSTLAPGDFIGSTNGNLQLVMRNDGNLVLYTFQMETNCQKMSDGNMGGGIGGNATYKMDKIAIPGNMGKLAYIDANAELHSYPSDKQQYSNNYTNISTGYDTSGNDIPGASFGNATLASCQTACNSNPNCAGIVTNSNGTLCFPKTSGMYPFGGPYTANSDRKIYVRNKIPTSPPIGVSSNTASIDTLTYDNYVDGGNLENEYGLAKANSVQKQQLNQLQSELNMLSNQISDLTTKFGTGSQMADNQSESNVVGINQYLQDINETNIKSKYIAGKSDGNIQNILKDSDIVVLQKNYDYLFWSILAAGTVLVSMNIIKK